MCRGCGPRVYRGQVLHRGRDGHRVSQRPADGQDAVVLHEDRLIRPQRLDHRVPQLVRAIRSVGRQGHARSYQGDQVMDGRDLLPQTRERRRPRGVRMHDPADLLTMPVYAEVHRHLARRPVPTLDEHAMLIHDGDVGGLYDLVGEGGRRDDHVAGFGNTQAGIPTRALRKPQLCDLVHGLQYFLPRLAVLHRCPPPAARRPHILNARRHAHPPSPRRRRGGGVIGRRGLSAWQGTDG